MATATEQITQLEEQLLELLASVQKPIVEYVGKAATKAEQFVPTVPSVPGSENVPPLSDLVLSQFTIAEKLLEQQRSFTTALLEAIKPVTDKVVTDEVAGTTDEVSV